MSMPASVPCTGAAATPIVSVTSRSSPPTRGAFGRGQGQAGQEDGELLALHPGEQCLRRRVLAQKSCRDEQQLVARGVTQGVGDLGVVAEGGQDETRSGPYGVTGQQLVG